MITLTLTQNITRYAATHTGEQWKPSGRYAIESVEFAKMLNRLSSGQEQTYLPHPLLEWARANAESLVATLTIEGEPDEPQDGPEPIH